MIAISHHERDQLYVVAVEGDLVNKTTFEVNEYLMELIESAKFDHTKKIRGIVLDCTRINFIDSAGVGLVCGKYIRLKRENIKFALCNLSAKFYTMLERLDLTGKLQIFSTVHDAVHTLGIKTDVKTIRSFITKTDDKDID